MKSNPSEPQERRLNIGLLRWVAILLPILFLAIVDILRHIVFSQELHTFLGFLATHVILAIAIVVFSFSIFALIGRLQRGLAERNRRLAALNSIAKAAAEKLRPDELMATSLDHVLEVMRGDAGLVCLVDAAREEHSAVCARGFSGEVVKRIQQAKLRDDPIASEVVRTGRPVIIENVLDDPRVSQAAAAEGIKSAISAPLRSEGAVNGILVIATRSSRRFTADEKEFLGGIGGQLGLAIRNAMLYEQAQRQNRELEALLVVGKAVASSLALDEVLNRALDTVLDVTSTDAAEVWLAQEDTELTLRCHRGASREAFFERTSFLWGEGAPGLAAQGQRPVLIHNLPADTGFLRQGIVKAGFNTFCALPLLYQGRLIGVLGVAALSAGALAQSADISLLEGIGERLAVAIANAQLHQQVQDLAVLQERERLAREMHDGMAQLLGYINAHTLAVKKLLSNQQLDAAREELTKMEEIARDLYADVREGILGLRMASRRDGGLLSVLREYVERFTEMSGVAATVQVAPDLEDLQLPSTSEIQLMRIAQESLSNVRKHARASAACVTLERDGDDLRVEIADDGQGFDPAHLPSARWPRFGLQTMQERAQAVGATLTIDTAPSRGTRVVVRMPAPRDHAGRA